MMRHTKDKAITVDVGLRTSENLSPRRSWLPDACLTLTTSLYHLLECENRLATWDTFVVRILFLRARHQFKPPSRLIFSYLSKMSSQIGPKHDGYSVSITYNKVSGNTAFFSDDSDIEALLERNKAWSHRVAKDSPGFFPALTHSQQPKILWIGCSDSRVPETTVMDLRPGEVFVHRNIANVIANGDMSMLSVVQFAVEVLQVKHVIISGHYGCGGVNAALGNKKLGLIDNWLRYVRDVRAEHAEELDAIEDEADRAARLVELNVLVQVKKIERISYVSEAVESRGLQVHPMVYDVATGRLKLLSKFNDKVKECYKLGNLDLNAH